MLTSGPVKYLNMTKLVLVANKCLDKSKGKYDYLYLFGGVYDLVTMEDDLMYEIYNDTGDLVDGKF